MLSAIPGVHRLFDAPHFHETALGLDRPVAPVLEALAMSDILGGFDLATDYPELGNALLVCATETKTDADLTNYRDALQRIMTGSNN
jgi:glycine dehydrogenase subunit 1